MAVRGRAGRARFVTNPRATFRERPEQEDDPLSTLAKIKTPADLVEACERAGARTRRTATGGYMVYGPTGGTTVIPSQWAHGRGRDNVLASVVRAGVDLAAPPATPQPAPEPEAPPVTAPPDTTPPPARNGATNNPGALAAKADLEAAVEMIAELSARITKLTETATARHEQLQRKLLEQHRTITALTAQIDNLHGDDSAEPAAPNARQRAQKVRAEIMAWFEQLPAGLRVPAGVVTGNLCTEETQADTYRAALRRLADIGQLEQHGNTGKRGGGARVTYSLPAPQTAEAER